MKIAVCFSGKLGKALAEELSDWLPKVLPGAEPFFAPHDIRKGERWFEELDAALRTSDAALLCLTDDDPGPWLFWEAGRSSHPYPLALGFTPAELEKGPLGQRQLTEFQLDDVRRLVASLNEQRGGPRLDAAALSKAVDASWPGLESRISAILRRRPRTFLQKIDGAWWERVSSKQSTHISFVRIRVVEGNGLRLLGDGYGKDGKTTAEWHSRLTFVDPVELSVVYHWEGTAEDARQGIGEIRFSGSEGEITAGSGSFSDDDGKGHYDKKRFKLIRATEAERAVMEGIDEAAKATLARARIKRSR